ncbi:MAG: hypothetical protein NTU44_16205 [Bacteroidetes bacterium]|nr:hypothetical protein [Bacteroidota bacterium]
MNHSDNINLGTGHSVDDNIVIEVIDTAKSLFRKFQMAARGIAGKFSKVVSKQNHIISKLFGCFRFVKCNKFYDYAK